MKKYYLLCLTGLLLLSCSNTFAQFPVRQDAIWARSVQGAAITLDGKLDEAAWSKAESLQIVYHATPTLPTSGYRAEFQPFAITDSTHATVKFLMSGNKLYLGFTIPDSSIGGTKDWARWDAILMSLMKINDKGRPAPPKEFFYSWWLAGLPDSATAWAGRPPRFLGAYGNFDGAERTPAQKAIWDAATVVNGIANDNLPDKGWNTEMVFSVDSLGYNADRPEGDVILFNVSIWDADHLFDGKPDNMSVTRTWWQSPWGNNYGGNVARIYARPDVTINSAILPEIAPDIILPSNAPNAEPVIDGELNEKSWEGAYTFEMAWDDTTIRSKYPGAGKFMSGQWQSLPSSDPRPPVLDPSYAKIRMFFHGDYLYLSADVSDQLLQGTDASDRMDAMSFIIGDRKEKDPNEDVMVFKEVTVSFGPDGNPKALNNLPALVDSGFAQYAVKLKGTSTVNKNDDVDEGYVLEAKVDLKKFNYPAGLGDRLLFMGAALYDGDSFDDVQKNYGTKTWWFTEGPRRQGVAWIVMDPNTTTGVEGNEAVVPTSIQLLGNYPNPFNPSTKLKYALPEGGNLNIAVYDLLGRKISQIYRTVQTAGQFEEILDMTRFSSGIYFYQISLKSVSGKQYQSMTGKMTLLK